MSFVEREPAGQGLVQELGVAGVQRGQEFDAQEFGNLFEIGLFGCGIGIVRHESVPWRGLNQVMIYRAKPRGRALRKGPGCAFQQGENVRKSFVATP